VSNKEEEEVKEEEGMGKEDEGVDKEEEFKEGKLGNDECIVVDEEGEEDDDE
jgi:hypothetical protein